MKKKPLLYFLKKGNELTKFLRIMRLITILMMIGIFQVNASAYSQNEVFSFKESGLTMRSVLKSIESKSKFKFFFNDDLTNVDKRIDLVANNLKIDQVLDAVLAGTNLSYKILENNLVIISPSVLLQQKRITGIITDANTDQPLTGVNIKIQGTNRGTVSDTNGKFSIDVSGPNAVFIFTYMGYLTESMTASGSSNLEIKLTPDVKNLNEVVVIGYGTIKKSDLTGSVTSVTSASYKDQPIVNITSALQGRTAGVSITNTSGAPGGNVKIRVRGPNSINGGNDPLYVVDGVALGNINFVNINDVESMEILKDASATAIYGSRGANGVVMITTKRGKTDKAKVEYSGFMSWDKRAYKYDLLNPVAYAILVNHTAGSAIFADPNSFAGKGTDWQDQLFQTGITSNHQLSISGGTEKARYYISGNYIDQSSMLVNAGQTKYAIRSNIDSKVNDKLSVSLNLSASRTNTHNNGDTGYKGSPVQASLTFAPTNPVYDDPALGLYHRVDIGGNTAINPYMIAKERVSDGWSNSALIDSKVKYKITDYLTFDVNVSLNMGLAQYANFSNTWMSPSNPNSGKSFSESVTFQNSNV